jgi:hypothetical protein
VHHLMREFPVGIEISQRRVAAHGYRFRIIMLPFSFLSDHVKPVT